MSGERVSAGSSPAAHAERAGRKPSWLKVKAPAAGAFRATGAVLGDLRLHTVCDEARCPNKGECFSAGTATFLILGDACTRSCGFCAIGRARDGLRAIERGDAALCAIDPDEPRRVAQAAVRLGLRHVVVTSVTRDDLGDGGAGQFAAAIAALRAALPAATVEVLVPDFGGASAALDTVLAARPDVLNHNLETVPRLYPAVRPQAVYRRSLALLERAAAAQPRPLVKTGLIIGLGETTEEIIAVLGDAARAGAGVVTVGQYLQPHAGCLAVARYISPEEFAALETDGARLGLRVVAGPFVRSSYHAGEVLAGDARTHS
jgi:lipoic acid synthetase